MTGEFRQRYMKLKNDYDDLFEKYVLCRKIALQLDHREECIEKNQTFCHICNKNYFVRQHYLFIYNPDDTLIM